MSEDRKDAENEAPQAPPGRENADAALDERQGQSAHAELSGKVKVNRRGAKKLFQHLLVGAQLNLGKDNRFREHFVNMEIVIGMLDLNAPKLALTDAPAMTEWGGSHGRLVVPRRSTPGFRPLAPFLCTPQK